ncbi:hypothetical protein MD588_24650 [Photobacterium sp. SDRW27]|uniref:hypothetical protein n=1 Tax=Photobacterium obscurum TaxID=2829490 RepID=UPI0022436FE3|nr:hypothetical protein [Photobacterium obscurum]MCW8331987.1 hypothetical protein [Photobacterium obscurum]
MLNQPTKRERDITLIPDIIRGSDLIDPASLSTTEKEHFVDSLYRLHSQIFDGVERADFVSYVVDSPADWTRIRVYKNSLNEWVGYCSVHRFNKKVFGRSLVIFRAEAGILRSYRGRSQTLWFAFNEAIKYRIRHPFSEIYYLGSFVHPSVLYMFSRYFSKYYPRADTPTPPLIKDLMLELAKVFNIEPVEKQDELARKVGWVTKESVEDRAFWQNHPHPVVKLYIETNPGYIYGNGLLTLVPLAFGNIFISLAKYLNNKLKKRLFDSND